MSSVNNQCLKICEELVKKCVISDKNILSYFPLTLQDHKEYINLNISTENDEYKFKIKLYKNEDNCLDNCQEQKPAFCIKEENILVEVRDVAIVGYASTECEKISVSHLKAVLKYLAYSHAKDIGKLSSELINHSLNETEFNNIRNVLFLLSEMNSEAIDLDSFKEGIQKLLFSSEEVLKSNKNNLNIRSKILRGKLFFKYTQNENKSVQCKIINIAPEKYLPLVYDVLLAIFYFSDETIRQYYFHELLDYYYDALEENLGHVGLNLHTILPLENYNQQVKMFIPYIKLETTYHYCQHLLQKVKTVDKADLKTHIQNFLVTNKNYKNVSSSMIFELYECILYTNLSREDCYKIIRNNIGSCEYEFLDWKITPVEIRSGNLGDYFNLIINIKQGDEHKKLRLFAKYLPTTNTVVVDMATASFNKEKFFYDTFISELNSLGLEEITDFLPKCCFSRSNDVLIFEDVSLLNYSSFKYTEPLTYESVKVVIKQLAKLHACSFLYEEIMTEKAGKLVRIDDNYKDYIQEVTFRLDKECKNNQIVFCGINTVLDYVLDAIPDVPKKYAIEVYKDKVKKAFDLFFEKVKKSSKYRNVICHGDFWGNNILFQMDRHNNPVTCYIIDYQLIRYCPPSHDLLFFLYVNTDRATRTNYMSELVDQYYIELANILKKYDFDFNKIYTYEEFLKSCSYMKSVAICIASLYVPMTAYPIEKFQEIARDSQKSEYIYNEDRKEILDETKVNEPYRQRIKELVEDLYELCESDIM